MSIELCRAYFRALGRVGDILEFDLCYATMVYLTSSRSVSVTFKTERG